MPTVHALFGPEDAHRLSIWLAKHRLVPFEHGNIDEDEKELLATELWGKTFSNPIGLAAGYDKHAEAIEAMFGFGFGFVEVGSVTPKPQVQHTRNATPRMFRLPQDTAVINRYGFNSDGHRAVADRLKARIRTYLYRHGLELSLDNRVVEPADRDAYGSLALPRSVPRSLRPSRVLGVNLGKNKTSPPDSPQDYVDGVVELGPFADYVVVNVSSPNTPGLRALQRREPMEKLMTAVKQARDENLPHRPPLLVKIAPDVSEAELEDIAAVVRGVGIDGVIISNTTVSRPPTLKSDPKLSREVGGLSGPPLLPLALDRVSKFYRLTAGAVPIIGCGGVATAADVLAFARAGASLVQVYTVFGYYGPGMIHDLKAGVVELLRKEEGGRAWREVVGKDHRAA
ncbi:Dihydroorotate dehydrogenase (quinone), mitochondrial [Cladochytrium tenue]|nr:Dihydroorotate dehydrogenase (quinone), mitochondrial [Cladochytrium tenue]